MWVYEVAARSLIRCLHMLRNSGSRVYESREGSRLHIAGAYSLHSGCVQRETKATVLEGGHLAFLLTALTPLIKALLHSCVSLEKRTTIPSTPAHALPEEGERALVSRNNSTSRSHYMCHKKANQPNGYSLTVKQWHRIRSFVRFIFSSFFNFLWFRSLGHLSLSHL